MVIIASMTVGLKLLLGVSDRYERLRGHGPTTRLAPVWRRGVTDTRRASRVRMLDVVMVITACAAIVALCVWFIALGGSTVRL